MDIVNRFVGSDTGKSADDYTELDAPEREVNSGNKDSLIFVATLESQTDMLDIKDEMYEGNIIIADISGLEGRSRQLETYIDELTQTAQELGGDIAQTGDNEIIISPASIGISRTKIGQ